MPNLRYCVFPPGCSVPSEYPEKIALAGYLWDYEAQQLITPNHSNRADLLVFNDAAALPEEQTGLLVQRLLQAASQLHATGIWADFERPPTPPAIRLLQQLQEHNLHILAPETYAVQTGAEPVVFWQPSDGSLAAFLQERTEEHRQPIWLDCAPVCRRIPLPVQPGADLDLDPDDPRIPTDQGHFCNALLLYYAVTGPAETPVLYLWDTPETLSKRTALAAQAGLAGVLTLQPEIVALRHAHPPNDADTSPTFGSDASTTHHKTAQPEMQKTPLP